MRLGIVHLSDLHIQETSEIDDNKISSISGVIQSISSSNDHIALVVTGDIAHSGGTEEYKKSNTIIMKTIAGIAKEKLTIAIVPGNHDCNYKNCTKVRETLINTTNKSGIIENDYFQEILKAQEEYRAFEADFKINCKHINELCKLIEINDGANSISITALNSAWMSTLTTKPGETIFPNAYINAVQALEKTSILLMHHTINWFSADQQRIIRTTIAGRFDFVLTGHEHESSGYKITKEDKDFETIMIEGGELSPFRDFTNSSFNVVIIDTESNLYKKTTYRFDTNEKIYTSIDETEWYPWKGHRAPTESGYLLNEKTTNYIKDSGAPYNHFKSIKLTLEDIYVSPDMDEIFQDDAQRKEVLLTKINFKALLTESGPGYAIIFGDERSGKTTLVKRLIAHELNVGRIPVNVSPTDVTSHDPTALERVIAKSYEKMYELRGVDAFKQAPNAEKTIIIDNFHTIKMRHPERVKMLAHMLSAYRNVILFIDENMRFDESVYIENKDGTEEHKIRRFTILPFGNTLRNQVIKKWYSDKFCSFSDEEYIEKIELAQSMVKVLVESNCVPPYPFYLYTAISALDGANNQDISKSSYATYYEMLIKRALIKISDIPGELDLRISYLSSFAHAIWGFNNSGLTLAEFNDFHKWYCQEYSIERDSESFLKALSDVSLIDITGDLVTFKYKYLYYYFTAKYFADHIDDEDTKRAVVFLCKTLHLDTSANIIMFLTNLSKNSSIIDCIVEQSKQIFGQHQPLQLKDDVAIVNELVDAAPALTVHDQSIEEFRAKELQYADELNPTQFKQSSYTCKDIAIPEQADDLSTYTPHDRLLLSLGATFRTLDIIGLVLKNYWGSLVADKKLSLCEHGYNLALRALSEYFDFITKNKTAVLEEVQSILNKAKEKFVTGAEREAFAKKEVYVLSEDLVYLFIKKAALSLSSQNLTQTYKQLAKANDWPSYALIDLAIKMHCTKPFPATDTISLAKRLSKANIIAFSVLRRLAVYHFYMYPVPYTTKQSLSESLQLSFSEQRAKKFAAQHKGIIE
jgi:UDP-2,3-diacylglucosamine pyrophosphatase LpxH